MGLFKLVKKNAFMILAIMCILLLIINNIKKPKLKENLTVCDDTCSSVTDGRINFRKFNQNIGKLMEVMGRLRGHCKNRCDGDSEKSNSEPVASNEEATDNDIIIENNNSKLSSSDVPFARPCSTNDECTNNGYNRCDMEKKLCK